MVYTDSHAICSISPCSLVNFPPQLELKVMYPGFLQPDRIGWFGTFQIILVAKQDGSHIENGIPDEEEGKTEREREENG